MNSAYEWTLFADRRPSLADADVRGLVMVRLTNRYGDVFDAPGMWFFTPHYVPGAAWRRIKASDLIFDPTAQEPKT